MWTLPNILTGLRLCLTVVIVILRRHGFSYSVLGVLVLIALLTDFFDGYIARKWNLETQFGKQFDHYVDKIFVLTLFVLIFIDIYPFNGSMECIIVTCAIVLLLRDTYIARLKVKHKTLPVLPLAQIKMTLQGVGLFAYFFGFLRIAALCFMGAGVSSLLSGFGYRWIAQGNPALMDAVKRRAFYNFITKKRLFTTRCKKVPSPLLLKELFSGVTAVILDIDGTMEAFGVPFSKQSIAVINCFSQAGIQPILYSNNPNKKRLQGLRDTGLPIYLGKWQKPYNEGYIELAEEFSIDLVTTVTVGDSPMTDSPVDQSLVLGSILVVPIKPTGWKISSWLHYFMNKWTQLLA